MTDLSLAEWLRRREWTIAQLSRETGLSYPTVLELSKGRGSAKYDTAEKISRATGGEISIESLMRPGVRPTKAPRRTGNGHAART